MKSSQARSKLKKHAAASVRPKPRRPLCPYNIFFKNERTKIILEQQQQSKDGADHEPITNKDKFRRNTQAHVGFTKLAQMIAKRWKTVDPEYKKELEEISQVDYVRYANEMKEWKEQRARDEELNQQEDTKPDAVLENEMRVILEQLEPIQDVFNIDQHASLTRYNEAGLSKDESDQLEDVTGNG